MSPREERDDDLGAVEPGRGKTVGKYQLLAVLGRGGMADVFLALSRGPMGFSKLVVLKRLRRALADDKGFRDMFLDEARLAARLNHPNVVHTHEVGEDSGNYFIAMEYLEGQSLNKVIRELTKRNENLPPLMCARIVSDALAGLHYAHELEDFDGTPLDIIHRDVSPHNVFVTYDGSVKMVDFGIAKAAFSSVQTEVGVLKGKVAYMAPEQAAGEGIDARADVFAMGIVLWELLAQERLMTGDSAAATLHRLLSAPIPKVTSIRSDVSPAFEAIIERALEKEPAKRFPSALAMRDALEDLISASGRSLRQEEIGRQMTDLFSGVREAIQKQIRMHMEGITEIPLHGESSKVGDGSVGGPVPSSQLPMLGVSGSGSGVVAGFTAPKAGDTSSVQSGPAPIATARGQQGVAGWLLLAALVGVVAIVAFTMGKSNAPPPASSDGVTEFRAPSDPAAGRAADPAHAATSQASTSPPQTDPTPAPLAADPVAAASAKRQVSARAVAPVKHGGSSPLPSPPVAANSSATPSDDGSEGYLTFDSYPWTQVSENGKSLGTTPIVHVALSPGTHTLSLENPEQSIKKSYSVTIKSGETVSRRLGIK
jgi:serine/threonine-protein kinase